MKLIPYEKYTAAEKREWYDKIELIRYVHQVPHVVFKPPFETMRTTYLAEWTDRNWDEPIPDPLPEEIYKVRGLHRHGGYHGFFKPDLDEVISLLISSAPIALDSFRKAYISTSLESEVLVYDGDDECHKGVTTVYLVQ